MGLAYLCYTIKYPHLIAAWLGITVFYLPTSTQLQRTKAESHTEMKMAYS